MFWTIKPTSAGLDWNSYVQVSVSEQYCMPHSRDPSKVRILCTKAQRVHIKPEISMHNPNPSQIRLRHTFILFLKRMELPKVKVETDL